MKLTYPNIDYVAVNEGNVDSEELKSIPKIHIIKLMFKNVTKENIDKVINNFPNTRRFVIEDNIKQYNLLLKNTGRKFYVENNFDSAFISFFRKNNKVLLNVEKLSAEARFFIFNDDIFLDMLNNIEIIQMNKKDYEKYQYLLNDWNGNVIITTS
jgi:hypothetical protein